ncbi:MAG: hypothetical protein KJ692_13050, partial [Verrucomicrobia bacterium]|nr:hypothetical protein [Verrucomicrobiota bacterium]
MNTIVKFHPERIRSKAALTFAIAAIGLLFTGWASPPVFSSVNALQSSNASCGLVPSLTTATNVKTQAEQAFPSLHGDLSRHSLGNKSVSADMEVVEFQFNPSSFAPGEHPTYVYHKTKNNGPGTIPQDIQLRSTYYISRNSTFGDSDDISIGTYITYSPSGGTPSGYYMTYTGCTEHLALITIPSDASGQYYVFIYRQFESVTCSDPNMANNHLLRSGTITVSGGEGPGTLQFSASSYTVKENGGSVSLSVTRFGGSDGAASVNYATADGTAIA